MGTGARSRIKQKLIEGSCLILYADYKDSMVTTDASKTGLGITLWQKQDDGIITPIAYGSGYLNYNKKPFNRGTGISSGMGLGKIPIFCIPTTKF